MPSAPIPQLGARPEESVKDHSSHFISNCRHLAGESLGSLVCRRLALQAFVMKSQALDVLFRLSSNQCQTPIHPPLVPLPGPLLFRKQVLKSEDKSPAFVLSQHKYLAPVAGKRCVFHLADFVISSFLAGGIHPVP